MGWRAADSLSYRKFLGYDLKRADTGSFDRVADQAAVLN